MRYLIPILAIILAACASAPMPAFAADLLTTWSAVTTDDTGAALPSAVEEYRVYPCGSGTAVATVPGSETELLETGVVTGTGTYCREVAAFLSPFEGERAQGTVIVVVPGQAGNVQVQALP
jgi:hypothetical protein